MYKAEMEELGDRIARSNRPGADWLMIKKWSRETRKKLRVTWHQFLLYILGDDYRNYMDIYMAESITHPPPRFTDRSPHRNACYQKFIDAYKRDTFDGIWDLTQSTYVRDVIRDFQIEHRNDPVIRRLMSMSITDIEQTGHKQYRVGMIINNSSRPDIEKIGKQITDWVRDEFELEVLVAIEFREAHYL